jgi:hypothetical protein
MFLGFLFEDDENWIRDHLDEAHDKLESIPFHNLPHRAIELTVARINRKFPDKKSLLIKVALYSLVLNIVSLLVAITLYSGFMIGTFNTTPQAYFVAPTLMDIFLELKSVTFISLGICLIPFSTLMDTLSAFVTWKLLEGILKKYSPIRLFSHLVIDFILVAASFVMTYVFYTVPSILMSYIQSSSLPHSLLLAPLNIPNKIVIATFAISATLPTIIYLIIGGMLFFTWMVPWGISRSIFQLSSSKKSIFSRLGTFFAAIPLAVVALIHLLF